MLEQHFIPNPTYPARNHINLPAQVPFEPCCLNIAVLLLYIRTGMLF